MSQRKTSDQKAKMGRKKNQKGKTTSRERQRAQYPRQKLTQVPKNKHRQSSKEGGRAVTPRKRNCAEGWNWKPKKK